MKRGKRWAVKACAGRISRVMPSDEREERGKRGLNVSNDPRKEAKETLYVGGNRIVKAPLP